MLSKGKDLNRRKQRERRKGITKCKLQIAKLELKKPASYRSPFALFPPVQKLID
jgi:hypothetical protein